MVGKGIWELGVSAQIRREDWVFVLVVGRMVRLEENGVEFYDDTDDARSYGIQFPPFLLCDRSSWYWRHRQEPQQDVEEHVIPRGGCIGRRRKHPYDDTERPFEDRFSDGRDIFGTNVKPIMGGCNSVFSTQKRRRTMTAKVR